MLTTSNIDGLDDLHCSPECIPGSGGNSNESKTDNKVMDFAYKYFTSPIVWFGLTVVAGTIFFKAMNMLAYGGALALISALFMSAYPMKMPEPLIYELAIAKNIVSNHISEAVSKKTIYYTEIFPKMYIGALPLESKDHHNLLNKKLRVEAVLSVVQPYEMERETVFSKPVSPKLWQSLGIVHKLLSTIDHQALSLDSLNQAADFIKAHEKGGIYVHCKSGMGRAPSAFIAYLMKHRAMNFEKAHNLVKAKRYIRLNKSQIEVLKTFEASLSSV